MLIKLLLYFKYILILYKFGDKKITSAGLKIIIWDAHHVLGIRNILRNVDLRMNNYVEMTAGLGGGGGFNISLQYPTIFLVLIEPHFGLLKILFSEFQQQHLDLPHDK